MHVTLNLVLSKIEVMLGGNKGNMKSRLNHLREAKEDIKSL